MPMDPEELQKRRMQRQQRRQARKRRSVVKLVVALLVLLFATAVIVALLGRNTDTPTPPSTDETAQSAGTVQTTVPETGIR